MQPSISAKTVVTSLLVLSVVASILVASVTVVRRNSERGGDASAIVIPSLDGSHGDFKVKMNLNASILEEHGGRNVGTWKDGRDIIMFDAAQFERGIERVPSNSHILLDTPGKRGDEAGALNFYTAIGDPSAYHAVRYWLYEYTSDFREVNEGFVDVGRFAFSAEELRNSGDDYGYLNTEDMMLLPGRRYYLSVDEVTSEGIRFPMQFSDGDGDLFSDISEDVNQNGEVDEGETDPANPDTDGDGLEDGKEMFVSAASNGDLQLDPLSADSDGDGIEDDWEYAAIDEPASGACCDLQANCYQGEGVTEISCASQGFMWAGEGTECGNQICLNVVPMACCEVDGSCYYETFNNCQSAGHAYHGGDVCESNTCLYQGACCNGVDCRMGFIDGCLSNIENIWNGSESCDPNPCIGDTPTDEPPTDEPPIDEPPTDDGDVLSDYNACVDQGRSISNTCVYCLEGVCISQASEEAFVTCSTNVNLNRPCSDLEGGDESIDEDGEDNEEGSCSSYTELIHTLQGHTFEVTGVPADRISEAEESAMNAAEQRLVDMCLDYFGGLNMDAKCALVADGNVWCKRDVSKDLFCQKNSLNCLKVTNEVDEQRVTTAKQCSGNCNCIAQCIEN